MASSALRCAFLALATMHFGGAMELPGDIAWEEVVRAKIPRIPTTYNSMTVEELNFNVQGSGFDTNVENAGPECCRRGSPCWPTAVEIAALSDALDPHATRNLHYNGGRNPIPAPFGGFEHQPLGGMTTNLKPLYERGSLQSNMTSSSPATFTCRSPYENHFCKAAIRNVPAENWDPAFVVFPVTVAHVQTAVKFARKHQLCVSVLGTGHDFLNRHSCNDGLMIRTTLLKDMQWNLDGVVKLGPGLTFSEVTKAGSEQQPSVYIATGWSSTVGIAGWHLAGGHGPLGPSSGLGVDNLVEIEVVNAEGNLVTANAQENSDLFWAMRGGGGSAWGVMTALTVRKHPTPAGGFTRMVALFTGDMCNRGEGTQHINALVDHWMDWALGLDEKWGGIQFMTSFAVPTCKSAWSVAFVYWYAGSWSDEAYKTQTAKLLKDSPGHNLRFHISQPAADWWRGMLPSAEKDIFIETWIVPEKLPKVARDFIPSALLSRDDIGGAKFRANVKTFMMNGGLGAIELYQDMPHPNVAKHFPANATCISSGFRNAIFHLISPVDHESRLRFVDAYENAYFAESNYNHVGDSWKKRYWGSNYDALLAVKKKRDPENMFWCHNCVGSDLPRIFPKSDQESSDVAALV